jgi:membrane carboxypeptidase/penicillin-binding protein
VDRVCGRSLNLFIKINLHVKGGTCVSTVKDFTWAKKPAVIKIREIDMIKKIGILFFLLVFCVFIYSFLVIHQAKLYTEKVILNDYKSGKWRIYEGEARPLQAKIEDLNHNKMSWLLNIQDPGFYQHKGIDLSTPGAGLTTITQAIVKKLYFKEFNSGFNKVKQSLIARFVAHEILEKSEQIVIFINSVYMGMVDGKEIYGLAQSSQVYYGKVLSQLSDDEYLSLVAMLIGPNQFNVLSAPEKNRERVARIKSVLSGEYKPKDLTDVYYNRSK